LGAEAPRAAFPRWRVGTINKVAETTIKAKMPLRCRPLAYKVNFL
jgi:hypothetical protein